MKTLALTPTMARLLGPLVLLGSFLGVQPVANADVLSASGSASTSELRANKNNSFTIRWNVTTTTDRHSPQALVANLATPQVIAGAITPTGQFYTENFNISGQQVQGWINAGYRSIVIRRSFTDTTGAPVQGIAADVQLRLVEGGLRSTRNQASFAVQMMKLGFSNLSSMTVVEPGEELYAYLDVNYSGTGTLVGSWQLAEPGSTAGNPLYRTLKLERKPLNQFQHSRLVSPKLPTDKPGKYLLRFCLPATYQTGEVSDECGKDSKRVEVLYQVVSGSTSSLTPMTLTANSHPVNGNTIIKWNPVGNAVVYQLQVFQQTEDATPAFITGMLIPNDSTQIRLSPLLLGKLQSHQRYLWRVNALDQQGRRIGMTPLKTYTFIQ